MDSQRHDEGRDGSTKLTKSHYSLMDRRVRYEIDDEKRSSEDEI